MKPQHSYHRHELDYRHGLKNAGSLAIAVTSGGTSGYEKSAEPMQEKLYQGIELEGAEAIAVVLAIRFLAALNSESLAPTELK
ncbi:hypothetical protein PI126_g19190 [Phytophthora idaei]|nr:hypothetical protein PI126_g19190 [Phytophthora idaei]